MKRVTSEGDGKQAGREGGRACRQYSLTLGMLFFTLSLQNTFYNWECVLDFIKYVFGTYHYHHMVFLLLALLT